MSQRSEEFGPFGSTEPVGRRRSPLRALVVYTFLILGICAVPLAVFGWNRFYVMIAETEPPTIEVLNPPVGIGLDPAQLSFSVRDPQSGIDEIIVRADQGGETLTIYREKLGTKVYEHTVTLTFDRSEQRFHEGPLQLSILAFDRSFWSNPAKSTVELVVDYRPPKIEVVSRQHNAVRGGVELVFYRIDGKPEGFSGVAVGAELFPGFRASRLDSAFEAIPDLHFAFFAVPLEFDDRNELIRVLARDAVGNTATASMYYRVRDRRYSTSNIAVSEDFLQSVVENLYQQYLTEASRLNTAPAEFSPALNLEELFERFEIINRDYRELIDEGVKPLFSRPKQERFWSEPFLRPPGRKRSYSFGDTLHYVTGQKLLGAERQSGTRYATAEGEPIRAANVGTVIFSGPLGLYGNTIVLDHGFGLTTLYGHLGKTERVEGDRVGRGEVIGAAGRSGLSFGPGVTHEFRLHGIPVRPEEWWDRNWLKGHIEDKIAAVKKLLGLEVRKSLE